MVKNHYDIRCIGCKLPVAACTNKIHRYKPPKQEIKNFGENFMVY